MSLFDARCAAVGATMGIRFNGEPVIVVDAANVQTAASAIVVLEEPLRETTGYSPTILEAKAQFLASDRNSLVPDTREPLRLIAQGYTWYVTDVTPDDGGLFEMFLRTELADQSHAVDLQGNQHPYG